MAGFQANVSAGLRGPEGGGDAGKIRAGVAGVTVVTDDLRDL